MLELPVLGLTSNVSKLDAIDADHLKGLWTLFTKCAENLENGRRLENLSWRLWYKEAAFASPPSSPLARVEMQDQQESAAPLPADIPELSSSVDSILTMDSRKREMERRRKTDGKRRESKESNGEKERPQSQRRDSEEKRQRLTTDKFQALLRSLAPTASNDAEGWRSMRRSATLPVPAPLQDASECDTPRDGSRTPIAKKSASFTALSQSPDSNPPGISPLLASSTSFSQTPVSNPPAPSPLLDDKKDKRMFFIQSYSDDDQDHTVKMGTTAPAKLAIPHDESESEEEDWDTDSVSDDDRPNATTPFPKSASRPSLDSKSSLLSTLLRDPPAPTIAKKRAGIASRSTPNIQYASRPKRDEPEERPRDREWRDGHAEVGSIPIVSPRTTRRNMLATELSESLRRNLLWERQQKNLTTSAVLKRRHTAHDMKNLTSFPRGTPTLPAGEQPGYNDVGW